MSLTLDSTLAIAQDSQSRNPLVEIISDQWTGSIPFDGQFLTSETTDEQKPNVIMHSSGRLCLVYILGTTKIKYVYTDTERTEFILKEFAFDSLQAVSLCEMVDGNIGIIFITGGTDRQLRYMILSPTGDIVTAHTLIAQYTGATSTVDMPFVLKLADETYLLVYYHKTVSGLVYKIMKRTSSDFITWSAESECVISGLASNRQRYNPSLLQITTGDIFLWFDYVTELSATKELTNCYYSISADNGVTWGAAVKITDYTTYGVVGKHPIAVQKTVSQMHLLFFEQRGALHMDNRSTFGWCGGIYSYIYDLSYDSVKRKLYVILSARFNAEFCIIKVDIDSWTVDKFWSTSTTPGFSGIFRSQIIGLARHGERGLIPVHIGGTIVSVLDGEADTITNYIFENSAPHGLTRNVDLAPTGEHVRYSWIDYDSKRLYLVFGDSYIGIHRLRIGFIDLNEQPSPGELYSFTTILTDTTNHILGYLGFYLSPGNDFAIVAMQKCFYDAEGYLKIYNLSSGGTYKNYRLSTNSGFPRLGLSNCILVGNKVYGGFEYEPLYGEAEKRGLCIIDLETDFITYARPTWATLDEYALHGQIISTDADELIITTSYGVAVYDTITGGWTLYNNEDLPGLTPNGIGDAFGAIAYSEEDNLIFAHAANGPWCCISAFSIYGFMKQNKYKIGEYIASWAFGETAPLTIGWNDYELVAALDPVDQSIYAFWTNRKIQELSIKWDKEAAAFDLSPYLLNGTEVTFQRSIDGAPASLSFSCSHGHLFDPTNAFSLWSMYLKKGRKLSLRFGEKVSDVDYWQDQGSFYVISSKLLWERGEYPSISVEAEDVRNLWAIGNISATNFYETIPVTLLKNVMIDHAGFALEDIDLPVFDNSVILWIQWIDTSLKDILEQVCYRFGYFPRMTVDGKFSARRISGLNAVDHVYSGHTWLINFTPDDSFSNFLNRVTVTGQSHDYIDVLFDEEMVGTLNGTCGWYGYKNDFDVYFSLDQSRRCVYPKLRVLETATSIAFKLAGSISESITFIDPEGFYCTVTVKAPSLVFLLVMAIGLIIASYWIPDIVVGLITIPIGRYIAMLGVVLALMVLGSIGNFQYEILACPIGKVRQSFQAQADDTDLQQEIGKVIEAKIDDPLCFTIAQCQTVANYEMDIVKWQRNRVKLTKLAHLQDEEGDTLQILHPYTQQPVKIFVTDLTRKFQKPSSPDSNDGYFLDDIEGWKIG